MAWNAFTIETSISCPKKSVSFLYGSMETSFRPYICPLYITGLIYRSGCLFSYLEARYHIFWVMNVILYRLWISLLRKYGTFWGYWYGMWLQSPFYLESILEALSLSAEVSLNGNSNSVRNKHNLNWKNRSL